MALLQSIVGELDRELTHLQQLRRIVVDLGHTPAVVRRLALPPLPPAAAAAPAAIEPRGKEQKRERRQREPKKPQAAPPARALVAGTPSGPVLVNPARLAEEREQRARTGAESADTAVQQPEDLDALSRSLATRWATQAIQ